MNGFIEFGAAEDCYILCWEEKTRCDKKRAVCSVKWTQTRDKTEYIKDKVE